MKSCLPALVLLVAASSSALAGDKNDDSKTRADAAATQLLAEARAARAVWKQFPGFRADVEVNLDGKVAKGTVVVDSDGKVRLEVSDPEALAWARAMIKSLVRHHLERELPVAATPCAFAGGDDAQHPQGREIRLLDDEFHSSYRIRDKQILVVNRQMGDGYLTISVLESCTNADKLFLPISFVVSIWKADKTLASTETHHQSWKRVGSFDLPVSLMVIKSQAGKLEARNLKLSHFQLAAAHR